jgi:hypothetical protein
MSAVIHRAVDSPAVPRSKSVGARSAGSGTVMRAWLASTWSCRSAASAVAQSGAGTTSSSRNAIHSVHAARQPRLRAAAGPAPPVVSTRTGSFSGRGSGAVVSARSSTTITSRGRGPVPPAKASRTTPRQARPTVGMTTV